MNMLNHKIEYNGEERYPRVGFRPAMIIFSRERFDTRGNNLPCNNNDSLDGAVLDAADNERVMQDLPK